MARLYSLRRSRQVFRHINGVYRRKYKKLPPSEVAILEHDLEQLDKAIKSEDRSQADYYARKLTAFVKDNIPKKLWEHVGELVVALIFALVVATVVRQVWFEPYTIPTGSMRPTLKEMDYLVVSKTDFGVNVPCTPDHFYFDPDLVERMSVVTFTVEDMGLSDPDTKYFMLFPGKKRYIKRLIAKPGDTLYFYGGEIYGIDHKGNDLLELRKTPGLEKIDHVPFARFEGQASTNVNQGMITTTFSHFNRPVGKVSLLSNGKLRSELYDGSRWFQPSEEQQLKSYGDFWGIKNFAMARLLTREEVDQYTDFDPEDFEEGLLYLELRHNPGLDYPEPRLSRQYSSKIKFDLTPYKTLVPLQQRHLDAIMNNLYTTRFVVRNQLAAPYRAEGITFSNFSPKFPNIPNGRYEFYYGTGYRVGWGGILKPLSSDHPLYDHSPQNVQRMFNLGVDMYSFYSPIMKEQPVYPSRFAYYREGDLYLMGAPVIDKQDPTMQAFQKYEHQREARAPRSKPYRPFVDHGPPLKDGKIDVDFIKAHGLQVPDKMYLGLGDNYAQSYDCREFGFIPEDNLRGVPKRLIWPLGKRFMQRPNMPSLPLFTLPRLVIWALAGLVALIYYAYQRWSAKNSVFIKLTDQ
ncbi:MAG: signal peptidase I [Chlamydiota bacterium]